MQPDKTESTYLDIKVYLVLIMMPLVILAILFVPIGVAGFDQI